MDDDSFEVLRRSCVGQDERWVKKTWQAGLAKDNVHVLAGSMTLESLGYIGPLSDCKRSLYPIDYCVSRVYWSTRDARRRCVYTCRIILVVPHERTPWASSRLTEQVSDQRVVHDESHADYDEALLRQFLETQRARREERIRMEGQQREEEEGRDGQLSCTPEVQSRQQKSRGRTKPRMKRVSRKMQQRTLNNLDAVFDQQSLDSNPSSCDYELRVDSGTPEPRGATPEAVASRIAPSPTDGESLTRVNLSCLSASTRLLLNKTSKLSMPSVPPLPEDEECHLTTIVDRLNQAASKNKRLHSRESSVDSQAGSTDGRNASREGSVERFQRISEVDKSSGAATITSSSSSIHVIHHPVHPDHTFSWPPIRQLPSAAKCQARVSQTPIRLPHKGSSVTSILRPSRFSVSQSSACRSSVTDVISVMPFGGVKSVGTRIASQSGCAVKRKVQKLCQPLRRAETLTPTTTSAAKAHQPLQHTAPKQLLALDISKRLQHRAQRQLSVPNNTQPLQHTTTPRCRTRVSIIALPTPSCSTVTGSAFKAVATCHTQPPHNARTSSDLRSAGDNQNNPLMQPSPVVIKLNSACNRIRHSAITRPPSPYNQAIDSECAAKPEAKSLQQQHQNTSSAGDSSSSGRSSIIKINSVPPPVANPAPSVNYAKPMLNNAKPSFLDAFMAHITQKAKPTGHFVQLDGSRDVKPSSRHDEHLRDQMVQKIKADSLAHSSVSECGPFKCVKCKRLYRTQDSWKKHSSVCDFEVSTSEDDDEEEDDDTDDPELQTNCTNSVRSAGCKNDTNSDCMSPTVQLCKTYPFRDPHHCKLSTSSKSYTSARSTTRKASCEKQAKNFTCTKSATPSTKRRSTRNFSNGVDLRSAVLKAVDYMPRRELRSRTQSLSNSATIDLHGSFINLCSSDSNGDSSNVDDVEKCDAAIIRNSDEVNDQSSERSSLAAEANDTISNSTTEQDKNKVDDSNSAMQQEGNSIIENANSTIANQQDNHQAAIIQDDTMAVDLDDIVDDETMASVLDDIIDRHYVSSAADDDYNDTAAEMARTNAKSDSDEEMFYDASNVLESDDIHMTSCESGEVSHESHESSDAPPAEVPHESSATPDESTKVLHELSEAQHESSEAQHESSEAPHESSEAQHESSEAPHESSEAKHESSEAHHESSEAPHESSEAQHESSEAPHESSEAQHESFEAPHESYEAPHESSEAQHESFEAPHESYEAPHESSEAPHGSSEAPHESSEVQHESSEAWHESSETPHGLSEAQHESSEAQHESSETRHESSETSHESSETPHESSQAPHESSETRHESSETSHESSETPHESSQAPHESSETRHESSETPHASSQAPHESSQAPHESSETRHESCETRHESSEIPHESSQARHESSEAQHESSEVPREPSATCHESIEAPQKSSEASNESFVALHGSSEAPCESYEVPDESSEVPHKSVEAPQESREKSVSLESTYTNACEAEEHTQKHTELPCAEPNGTTGISKPELESSNEVAEQKGTVAYTQSSMSRLHQPSPPPSSPVVATSPNLSSLSPGLSASLHTLEAAGHLNYCGSFTVTSDMLPLIASDSRMSAQLAQALAARQRQMVQQQVPEETRPMTTTTTVTKVNTAKPGPVNVPMVTRSGTCTVIDMNNTSNKKNAAEEAVKLHKVLPKSAPSLVVKSAPLVLTKSSPRPLPKSSSSLVPRSSLSLVPKSSPSLVPKSVPSLLLQQGPKPLSLVSQELPRSCAQQETPKQKVSTRLRKQQHAVLTDLASENQLLDHGDHGPHPLIHPIHQHAFLPEAIEEEEVRDTVPFHQPLQDDDTGTSSKAAGGRDAPRLVFDIASDDGFHTRADSSAEAWKAVTDAVQDARANAHMKPLSFCGVNGLKMFGLSHNAIIYLVEQLNGAGRCRNYLFKHHRHRGHEEDQLPENPSGCARSETFASRKPSEMFSFLLSKHRNKPEFNAASTRESEMVHKSQRRKTAMDLPMAMRFRHLRSNAKQACNVFRSGIHGRGLFCKRDLDAGEMIIEYAGQVIRASLTDQRENYYESKGIGCYMFRIDDDDVVDATIKGNAARFINHCCEPNCYSKVIQVDDKKHIIIFAIRPIKRGEELTYDYKFPIEDVKIPCSCGAKKCRRYLN